MFIYTLCHESGRTKKYQGSVEKEKYQVPLNLQKGTTERQRRYVVKKGIVTHEDSVEEKF